MKTDSGSSPESVTTVKDIQTLYESLSANEQQLYIKNQKFYGKLIKAITDKMNNGSVLDNPLAWIAEYYSENYKRE